MTQSLFIFFEGVAWDYSKITWETSGLKTVSLISQTVEIIPKADYFPVLPASNQVSRTEQVERCLSRELMKRAFNLITCIFYYYLILEIINYKELFV